MKLVSEDRRRKRGGKVKDLIIESLRDRLPPAKGISQEWILYMLSLNGYPNDGGRSVSPRKDVQGSALI